MTALQCLIEVLQSCKSAKEALAHEIYPQGGWKQAWPHFANFPAISGVPSTTINTVVALLHSLRAGYLTIEQVAQQYEPELREQFRSLATAWDWT